MKTFTCVSKLLREDVALCQTSNMHLLNPDMPPTKLRINQVRYVAVISFLMIMGVGQMLGATAVYKTALFGSSYNSGGVNNYTSTWSATNDGFQVDLQNFNNNNNAWSNVKCGRNGSASTATIITHTAIDQAITKVSINISAITAGNVTSITLYTSSNGSTWSSAGTFTKGTGNQQVVISSPAANRYYKITFVCTSGKSNGLVTVNDVKFYYNGASCNSIDVTGGSAVTLPAGSTTYTANDWKNAGSPAVYEGETEYLVGASRYCVSFTHAADYGNANGLQLQANNGVLQISGITSTYGVDVAISANGTNNFTVALTGASEVTGNNTTLSISTTNQSATLTISKTTNNVGYIKYITITPKVACNDDPTIGATSITNSPFVLTSLTGVISVNCTGSSTGSATCTWVDRGYVWSLGTTTTTPTVSNNKVAGGNGDQATGWAGSITPSGSTTPTAWEVGKTYYIRAYGKNGKAEAAFAYGTAASFTLRSITFNSNGGSTVGPWYVNSGGTYAAPTAPTKTGYTFGGWYTDNGTFENAVDWSAAVSENKTYYAKWTANTISLTLDKNHSDVGANGSGSVDYDATSLTSISHATRSGYNIEGYYADPECTHKVLSSSGVLVNYTGYVVDDKWARTTTPTTLYANWTSKTYEDYVFSCAELTLEAHLVTSGTPIFITSTANKKVRSQDYIQITGSGLTPNTTLTFPDLNSKFEIKTATYGDLATDADGAIDAAAYIFYTPDVGSTSDGLDKITGITVTVEGAKTKTASLTQDIIGRHLPEDFVIAAKKDGKWYALPADMTSTTHPAPAKIAVDNATNPSVAYTAATNLYNLYGQNSGAGYLEEAGQYVKLGMKNNPTFANYPLLGTALTAIGKSTGTDPTHNLDQQYWWLFTQTNTSISNPQDAKYTIYCANNTTNHLRLKDNAGSPEWGLYDSGIDELRLIPASDIIYTEAYFVEWGQRGGIIEVDATGIDATSVVAHLGENTCSSSLTNAGTSGKPSTTTKYNYIVDFENINFAAPESNGAMLTLEWKKDETVKAMTNINVPKIIAADGVMKTIMSGDAQWETEVHVLPGVTLEANAGGFESNDVMIKHLEIYPGATVVVTKGAAESGTLKVKTLVLRNGWTRVGSKKYDVARLYITPSTASLAKNAADDVWYSDWYIDFDQYYPIAVPWEVDLSANDGSKIWYKNTNADAIIGSKDSGGSVRLRYYDGASRATNGQAGVGDGVNWKHYGDVGAEAIPTKLVPGKGYAMTAKRPTGKAFSIVRMPLTIASSDWTAGGEKGEVSGTHKDQVSVTAHVNEAGTTPQYAKGWNFIANPFMSLYHGPITHSVSDDYDIEYVSIPDTEFKEFGQYPIGADMTKFAPSSGFLIQAEADGVLTFGTTYRKASAPSYRNSEMKTASKQKAYIILSDEDAEDMMGILVSEKYTADYELNADLEKLLSDGNTLRTYMRYNDMNMAYLAINEELAKQLIPVSVRIPAEGEYTFKIHEASIADELEGIYLTDYQTNIVTNLLYDSYTFNAVAGTDNVRFAINAVIGKREVPTGVDISDSNKDRPTKFIWNDKVYILHNNVIYDSTGKRVNMINK